AQVLNQGKQRVSEKRYISGCANLMMVQFKHLHAPLLPAIGLWWALELAKNVVKRDMRLVQGTLRAGRFTLKNLPALVADRRRLRGRHAGLAAFFTDSTFNDRRTLSVAASRRVRRLVCGRGAGPNNS